MNARADIQTIATAYDGEANASILNVGDLRGSDELEHSAAALGA